MKLKHPRISILLIVSLLIINISAENSPPIRIALLPLANKSGFSNHWELEKNLPVYFASFLDSLPEIEAFSPDSLQDLYDSMGIRPGKRFTSSQKSFFASRNIDIILTGVLGNFEINKIRIGNPLLAGLSNYSCYIKINFLLSHAENDKEPIPFTIEVKRENRGLQFTPQGKRYKPVIRFSDLDTMKFDSPQFRRTLIGQTIRSGAFQLRNKLSMALNIPINQKSGHKPYLLRGKVVSRTGDRIHINLGSSDGIYTRQYYRFYLKTDTGDKMALAGELEILMVKDSHLSLARVLNKSILDIQIGDEIILQPR